MEHLKKPKGHFKINWPLVRYIVYCKVPKLYIVCKLDPWHRYYKNSFDQIELKVPFSVFHLRIRRKFTLSLFLLWQNLICKKLPFVGEKFLLKKSHRKKTHQHISSNKLWNGQSIFYLPHRPKFSDLFDLCLHWVSVVRANKYSLLLRCYHILNENWAQKLAI